MKATRRFPPPWTVEELDACFVTDSAGQKLPSCSVVSTTDGKRLRAKMHTSERPGEHGGWWFLRRRHPQLASYPGRRRRPPV